MMDIKQMVEVLGMSRNAVQRIAQDAGIKAEKRSFKHGKKLYYQVTPERLIELKKNQNPEYVSARQGASLNALELAFGGLKSSTNIRVTKS